MKKRISILLCLALLAGMFGGCTAAHTPEAYEPTGNLLDGEEADIQADGTQEEQTLSLAYYADESLNPLMAADFTNRALMPLIYQSLFAVNRDYEVIPILCKQYTASVDLMTYEFTVDPAATFSDGTPVTAEDVVASLQASRNYKFYGRRLSFVSSISVTEAGKVRIQLSEPNSNLPLLLDIPIVKAAEVEADYPLGSGPYVLGGWGSNRYLTRRTNWWCSSKDLLITAEKIPLVSAESPAAIRDAFEFADVGVVCTDPGSDRYAEYRCDYELWNCETGIFLYLGVNKSSSVFQDKTVRQALSRGVDRDYLVDHYYRGFARSASLPASPDSPFYTASLAQKYAYDAEACQSAMSSVKGSTITLLVNASDSLRVRVAQEIGRMLNASGLIVEVVSKDEDYYLAALNNGDFDLYLGQTKLSPNMDLTPFFSENGALDYGGMSDVSLYSLCLQALENQGNYYTLHQTVMEEGYLCPIAFRCYAVYAARGLLTDLAPARDNLFCYSIGRTQTDAYIVDDQ